MNDASNRPPDEKAMATYRSLMVEVKYRTEAIDQVLSRQLPLRGKIGEELCYLQLRMICELLAIGCLVIHGGLKPKGALFKTYKADWIMSELAKVHPKFFPVALEQNDSDATDPPSWVHKKGGFLTREGLAELWGRRAGGHLHRGSFKNLLAREKPLDLAEVQKWRDLIVGLLTRHVLTTPDEEHVLYVAMNDGEGNVFSALFARVPGDA